MRAVPAPSPREAELVALLAARDARLEELARENALLRQKVDALVRRLFGSKSERLDPDQLLLLLAGAPPAVAAEVATPTAAPRAAAPTRSRRGPRLPAHLPVVEEVLAVAVTVCPGAWRRVGHEVSESLDYTPGRFFKRRLVRPKYVARRSGGNAFLIAPLPAALRERGLAARASWPRSSSLNTPITCPSTGRSRSTRSATAFTCPGRRWRAGWSWRPTG